jgi:hypothetical protein
VIPCPFCGAVPEVEEVGHWTGMRNVPIAYRIMHHCVPNVERGRMFIEFQAPTEQLLAEYWERRAV